MSYFPYGFGPRKCIASALAQMELTLALAMLVTRYRLLPSPKYRHVSGHIYSLVTCAIDVRVQSHDNVYTRVVTPLCEFPFLVCIISSRILDAALLGGFAGFANSVSFSLFLKEKNGCEYDGFPHIKHA